MENRFQYTKLPMLMDLGGGVPEKPTKNEMCSAAMRGIQTTYVNTPESYWQQIANDRGVFDPKTVTVMKVLALAHECMVASYCVVALNKGAVIHVRDSSLVEALLRTDVDAMVGDMRMPFPIVELAFPNGIRLDDRYEVSGCLMVDMEAVNIKREFGDSLNYIEERGLLSDKKARYIIMSALRFVGSGEPADEVLLKFGPEEPIDDMPSSPDMRPDESSAISRLAKLACSLFLYLQSVDRNRAMQPLQYAREMGHRLPAAMARMEKRRPRYAIRDILTKPRSKSAEHGGHHASPEVHWRKGHMRVLRDERFARNEDGSVKSIWIRPCLISAGDDEQKVTAERQLVKEEVGT
jgi:hypothetical protein